MNAWPAEFTLTAVLSDTSVVLGKPNGNAGSRSGSGNVEAPINARLEMHSPGVNTRFRVPRAACVSEMCVSRPRQ